LRNFGRQRNEGGEMEFATGVLERTTPPGDEQSS